MKTPAPEALATFEEYGNRLGNAYLLLRHTDDPRSSLTVWDCASSHSTLFNMLVATLVMMPIIVAYTSWVYKMLWGKVRREDITDESRHAY